MSYSTEAYSGSEQPTAVGVEVYIGVGSNLGEPAQQLMDACRALQQAHQITLLASSRWYPSAAVGPGEQPDYLNAVVKIKTALTPHELLDTLQGIEQEQGRQRRVRWGARTLDLDILLYGDASIHDERLTVPHAYLTERNFVVMPLMELCPEAKLPNGQRLADIASTLTHEGLGQPQSADLPINPT